MVGFLSCRESNSSTANSDAFIRNAPCAFNYIIYPIFVHCYVMGRFGHENGPFWMLAGAVLVLFFLPLGPFWFAWAVFDLHWDRFGDGPFWSVPGNYYTFLLTGNTWAEERFPLPRC